MHNIRRMGYVVTLVILLFHEMMRKTAGRTIAHKATDIDTFLHYMYAEETKRGLQQ